VVKAALLALALAACQDAAVSRALGAECTSDHECDDVCATGGAWPEGMCTLSCMSDTDCPSEAACITDQGGICAYRCQTDMNCRFLGPAYACKQTDQVMVCRGD